MYTPWDSWVQQCDALARDIEALAEQYRQMRPAADPLLEAKDKKKKATAAAKARRAYNKLSVAKDRKQEKSVRMEAYIKATRYHTWLARNMYKAHQLANQTPMFGGSDG